MRGSQWEAEALLGQRLWGAKEWDPRPPWSWPVLGEEGGPSGPPWYAEHLWNPQRHLLGTLDCRRKTCVGYENACHVRRGRSTQLPFLQKKKKKKEKPFTPPFLSGLRGQMWNESAPPPPSQEGPFPCRNKGAGCLRDLPFYLASKGRIKQNRKTAQSRF